jgi:hypothetical protein
VAALLAAGFLAARFFAEVFLAGTFLVAACFAAGFFAGAEPVFFLAEALPSGGGGIFTPAFRASDKAIAIACLGFVTLAPLPERSFPASIAFISRCTVACALGPYFASVVLPAVG